MPAEPLPLHEAIAACIDGRCTQTELAELLGVGQSTISKWVRGALTPGIDDIPRIEGACRRERGFIFEAAGYVTRPHSTAEAIERDPRLDDLGRAIVLAAYESASSHHEGRR